MIESKHLQELDILSDKVTFDQSNFQDLNFGSDNITDERKLRHHLLQAAEKRKALQYSQFERRKAEVDILELEEKISKEQDKFQKMRYEIDLQEKQFNLEITKKLIKDAVEKLSVHIAAVRSNPKYDLFLNAPADEARLAWEKSESEYWSRRLINDAERQMKSVGTINEGTLQSLELIGVKTERVRGQLMLFPTTDIQKQIMEEKQIEQLLLSESFSQPEVKEESLHVK